MENTQKKASETVNYDVFTSFVTPKKHQEILERMNVLFESSGMSAAQLSRMTSISESTITRYFSGDTKNPHFYTMVTMILAMGGDMNEILGLTLPSQSDGEVPENPYGELLDSYREEVKNLREETGTLRTVIESLRTDFDALTKQIGLMARTTTVRTIVLVIIIGIFCTLEIIDICNPDWGRYQWATELFHNFLYNIKKI